MADFYIQGTISGG